MSEQQIVWLYFAIGLLNCIAVRLITKRPLFRGPRSIAFFLLVAWPVYYSMIVTLWLGKKGV